MYMYLFIDLSEVSPSFGRSPWLRRSQWINDAVSTVNTVNMVDTINNAVNDMVNESVNGAVQINDMVNNMVHHVRKNKAAVVATCCSISGIRPGAESMFSRLVAVIRKEVADA